jgi:hypothetical protein
LHFLKDYRNQVNKQLFSLKEIEYNLKNVSLLQGGLSLAKNNHNCSSNYSVALIVPYRDRLSSLQIFLNNIHSYLTRQKINYVIYLVEPVSNVIQPFF